MTQDAPEDLLFSAPTWRTQLANWRKSQNLSQWEDSLFDTIDATLAALSRRVPASGGGFEPQEFAHTAALLRQYASADPHTNFYAIASNNINVILAALDVAASPIVAAEGWRLVPEYPDDTMMQAGLYQSSHDAEWADVFQSYVDMVRVAPTAPNSPSIPEGKAEPAATVREALRKIMVEQPISGRRETYSDGYASGLATAIEHIDRALSTPPGAP